MSAVRCGNSGVGGGGGGVVNEDAWVGAAKAMQVTKDQEANLEVCPSYVPELQRLGGRSHGLVVKLCSTSNPPSVLRNAASDEGPAGSAWA